MSNPIPSNPKADALAKQLKEQLAQRRPRPWKLVLATLAVSILALGFIAWWPMAACMMLGYFLAWYWQRQQKLLKPVDFAPPVYWTERDHQARKVVEETRFCLGR